MNYKKVSSIYNEIAKIVPLYKTAARDKSTEVGTQWTFPQNSKFNFENNLARLKLAERENSHILQALSNMV